jgi:hypothetical protein
MRFTMPTDAAATSSDSRPHSNPQSSSQGVRTARLPDQAPGLATLDVPLRFIASLLPMFLTMFLPMFLTMFLTMFLPMTAPLDRCRGHACCPRWARNPPILLPMATGSATMHQP